jgi:hypothetical protein
MNGGVAMKQILPWEKPRIKRILDLFTGSKVYNIKKITTVKEVNTQDEIDR